jgi:hypothetical protein
LYNDCSHLTSYDDDEKKAHFKEKKKKDERESERGSVLI